MRVDLHREAEAELNALPGEERHAMENALEKLEVYGDHLPFPHSSKVKGAENLRELRPRSGRSAWRAFYRRIGDSLVVGAIGPEAKVDPPGFRRAARAAENRLTAIESERKRDEQDPRAQRHKDS